MSNIVQLTIDGKVVKEFELKSVTLPTIENTSKTPLKKLKPSKKKK